MKTASPFCCGECGKPAKVLMKCGRNRDDWVYSMCDHCLEYLCPAHADEDESGHVICDTCYQQAAIRRMKEPHP